MRYLYKNAINNAELSLSGSSPLGGTDVTHIATNHPSFALVTDAITAQYINITFPVAQSLSGIFIENISLDAGDTLTLETSDDNFVSAPLESITLTIATHSHYVIGAGYREAYRRYAYNFFSLNRRYYRIKMIQAIGTGITVGEVYLAESDYTDDKNIDESHTVGADLTRIEIVSPKGQYRIRNQSNVFIMKNALYQYTEPTQVQQLKNNVALSEYVIMFPYLTSEEGYHGGVKFTTPDRKGNEDKFDILIDFREAQ